MTSKILAEYDIPEVLAYSQRWRRIVEAAPGWNELTDIRFLLAILKQFQGNPNALTETERITQAHLAGDRTAFIKDQVSRSYLVLTDDEILKLPDLQESDLVHIDAAFDSLHPTRK